MKLPLLVIAGPTGVGKTAAAVALGARVPIEIISADSRQVYRFMDAATGKPTAAERAAVRHHLVDIVDPDDRYQAARFRRDAAALVSAIHGRGRLAVVVGGTGLYIRALVRGLDPAPPADPALREELAATAAREGREALHARLAATAPDVARRLHPRDQVRVMRALEKAAAGPRTEELWTRGAADYDVVCVGLTMAREALAARLHERAAAMAKAGLAEEVEALLARGYVPGLSALQGIGYREFVQVVRGTLDVATATALMQRDTVRYAKRQLTWFAREPDIRWLEVSATAEGTETAGRIEECVRQGGLH